MSKLNYEKQVQPPTNIMQSPHYQNSIVTTLKIEFVKTPGKMSRNPYLNYKNA